MEEATDGKEDNKKIYVVQSVESIYLYWMDHVEYTDTLMTYTFFYLDFFLFIAYLGTQWIHQTTWCMAPMRFIYYNKDHNRDLQFDSNKIDYSLHNEFGYLLKWFDRLHPWHKIPSFQSLDDLDTLKIEDEPVCFNVDECVSEFVFLVRTLFVCLYVCIVCDLFDMSNKRLKYEN